MPRETKRHSIDDAIRSSIEPIVKDLAFALAGVIAGIAADRLETKLFTLTQGVRAPARRSASRGQRAAPELTRWAADRRARRLPTFVIQMTGLDTKKKLVAKFGENAVFEKGKPAPAPKTSAVSSHDVPTRNPRLVKAKPPLIRRASAR